MANRLERAVTPAVATLQGGVGLAILRWGDSSIPLHFDWAGEANGYGSRQAAAALVIAMALLTLFFPMLVRLLSRRAPTTENGFREATLVMLGVSSLVCALIGSLAVGWLSPSNGPLGVMSAISAILAVIGAYLGKVGPNALVGVRTPWTFASRLAWDKANRLAGRLFFWGGLAGFIFAPFAPQPAGLQVVTALVLIVAALSVYESWRVWRTDPDRTSAL